MTCLEIRGFQIWKDNLDVAEQKVLVAAVRRLVKVAPLRQPDTPYGRPMSVRMTSAGTFGWHSDRRGYRYTSRHPDGMEWPAIPQEILAIWDRVTGLARRPDCCLVNWYDEGARMGLHQDRDEADFTWPVVSISLGDDGLFRIGNQTRGGTTESVWLASGDVVVMGGGARLTYHGIDRIRFGSSRLLSQGGRLNLTLRVVT
ncbi:alpha-ketoglutarate-dependent dioxygenase AlkB family protein [Sedimentitalea todarodis]|uniref:Alpha-ketoglutarate-dependent dioxygenase AlkB n=1 Tax=Sedimentitalea todarodis TaxID=1631240 RepID=A0ABU3VK90_9RHOB|nr:alpha-ketoglutarate-dependent dioxygenase AlkB [Sedimentitalea todarodis]MDU9006612.1 alpha-ketoglutarate-dependent dioxygenase AlkB [Sedimentitalea todarodis]